MNLIDAYRYLAALEQHRHFGRAAAACHITQPALSNALRALETHLGVAIVRRGRQYEGLTPEGTQVLATAHRVLREQETLLQELSSSAATPRGRLAIGTVPTALPVAARFAARLIARHPGIVPELRSLSSQQIETGLDTLSLDLALGFTDRVAGLSRLSVLPQYVEHYHLVRHDPAAAPAAGIRADTVARGEPIGWARASTLPLCLLTPEMHHRALLDQVFRDLGVTVAPVLETDAVMALVVAVQAGASAAVMPGALVHTVPRGRGLRAQPLVDPDLRTPVGFIASTTVRPSRALAAALALAADPDWLAEARAHSGPLAD